MTAEQGVKAPIKEINVPKDLPLISVMTAASAAPIVEQLAAGKKPDPKDVSIMVEHVAEDLRAQGATLSSSDVKAAQEKVEKSYSPSAQAEKSPSLSKLRNKEPLPPVDLKEYETVVDNIFHTYRLPKENWHMIRNALSTVTITGNVVEGLRIKAFGTKEGREDIVDKFNQVSDALELKKISPKEFLPKVWSLRKEPLKARDIGWTLLRASAPIWSGPAHWLIEGQVGKFVNKAYLQERAKLQERINSRIADSLFMRNFEFLHNQSAGETMDVINRGKDATLDLMSVVHMDLGPLKIGQWGSVVKQFIAVNDWKALDAWFGVVKKLVLETRIGPNATRIQKQRDEELRLWDKMNTKLLTTMQGLETARTAGNAEAGSDVLYGSLAERDYIEAGGMREKMRQDRAMNKIFDILDITLPVASETLELKRFLAANPNAKAFDMLNNVADAYFRVTGSQGEQQALRQSFQALTHLYTDRIIPDIQDIKRMDELLGPYDLLDTPDGLRERARVSVNSIKNFDIKVQDLHFKDILHGVNLDIPQGAFVTIKGPSGIGKSTLFRHLVGLYGAQSGAIQYGGTDINGIKKYGDEAFFTKIAYVNQSPQYFEDMTLRENLLLWTKKEIPSERVESVLRDLKLDQIIDRLDTKSKHFSGGEMRRIGIARALLKDPKVLFLDEPTANLDAASTLQVMKIIQELRRKRPDMTVVAITHDPVFEKIAEKIVDFEQLNKAPILGDHQVLEAMAKPN